MKKNIIFSVILCFAMVCYFLIVSFSGISIAEDTKEKQLKECVDKCNDKGNVCINMTADPRRCEAIVQECVDACKAEASQPEK